jgi:hypothetical protein
MSVVKKLGESGRVEDVIPCTAFLYWMRTLGYLSCQTARFRSELLGKTPEVHLQAASDLTEVLTPSNPLTSGCGRSWQPMYLPVSSAEQSHSKVPPALNHSL